jgi:UDP-glucose 6-dehydrogenase
MKLKIGIVGIGMVGGTLKRWLVERKGYVKGENLFCCDKNSRLGYHDDVNQADLVAVCVPTPMGDNGECDISIVQDVVSSLRSGMIVVIKSTVVPGTTVRLSKRYPDKKFLFSPEYLTEGQAWEDFIGKCGRQIVAHVGQDDESTIEYAKMFLDILPMSMVMMPTRGVYRDLEREIEATEAELAKYFANIFGMTKVILDNIFKDIGDAINFCFFSEGIEARVRHEKVEECVGLDPRIGPGWLNVNHGNYRGAGGYCFPKDFSAMIYFTIKDLLTLLSSHNSSGNEDINLLRTRLHFGGRVLQALWDYNEQILWQQGTDIEEVSKHDKELRKKLKKLRNLGPKY